MANGIAKELAEKLLKSEKQVERVEDEFENAPKIERELELIPNVEQNLLETLKEEET
jgi:predicted fused transcriptional regulator/phosphomethylpyrimidine kinase